MFFTLLVLRFETVGFLFSLFHGGDISRRFISQVSLSGVSSLWKEALLVDSPPYAEPYAGSGIVSYSLYSKIQKPKPQVTWFSTCFPSESYLQSYHFGIPTSLLFALYFCCFIHMLYLKYFNI